MDFNVTVLNVIQLGGTTVQAQQQQRQKIAVWSLKGGPIVTSNISLTNGTDNSIDTAPWKEQAVYYLASSAICTFCLAPPARLVFAFKPYLDEEICWGI